MDGEKSGVGASINEWATALRKGRPEFSSQIDIDRQIRDEGLARLNLPRYKKESYALPDFQQKSDEHFNSISTDRYYISLEPTGEGKKEGLKRLRAVNQTKEQALQYIHANVPAGQESKYKLVLSEFFKNEVSGQIMINPDGRILMEAAKGEHGPVVSGAKTPEYIVKRDEFMRTFKYFHKTDKGLEELEDETLKKALYNTLNAIPHQGEDREQEFTPGYYEFALVKRKEDRPLEPIFFEYQDNPAYQLR
jgi:hypothetical protein